MDQLIQDKADELNRLHRRGELTKGSLALIDDDPMFRRVLRRTLERDGFDVHEAENLSQARDLIRANRFDYAVLDLRLEDGYALQFLSEFRQLQPKVRVVIVTGFGNIASAVAAVKQGAVDYLAKPVDGADVIKALRNMDDGHLPPPPENPMSADRVRWEHIQRIFEQCDRNVSETARRLNMHRRTLQRILSKRAPRE
ncbi:MAG: response regulator [Geminicoccaceae bacterium]